MTVSMINRLIQFTGNQSVSTLEKVVGEFDSLEKRDILH